MTQADIDAGEPRICIKCPIALAMRRAGARSAWVGADVAVTDFAPLSVPLPEEAVEFIRRYDAGEPVQPFSFEL